jgi:hypothetical protein
MIPTAALPGRGQVVEDRLDHDDGPIDEEAEVERAEAHEVAGHVEEDHPHHGAEHRERDHRGDEAACAHAAEHREEDERDEHAALEEARAHRAKRREHELLAVVGHLEGHVLGEARADGGQLGVDARHHLERVLTAQHLAHHVDDLAASVRGADADAWHLAFLDARDV